ncbi:PREDICTED: uncharacterized protein LOC106815531 [Priapulus caudatus]|uniref:Uncharacterized protein LOC106815531 n=1 Tax=Priapulus caudatus TaxID=37621 RepID=A0ABM1ETG1_PRICU|nr:PREDICTED: uncharacterized protein LOC106815531 [Priapulus caudatus]
MASKQDISDMRISELQAELRTFGAKVSGRKQELCERLEFYRRNKTSANVQPEYRMDLPDASHYKDLHAGMVELVENISLRRIEEYLQQFDKRIDSKTKDFYEQRFLRFVRIAKPGGSTSVYISSSMWSEMKKSVSYPLQ